MLQKGVVCTLQGQDKQLLSPSDNPSTTAATSAPALNHVITAVPGPVHARCALVPTTTGIEPGAGLRWALRYRCSMIRVMEGRGALRFASVNVTMI